MNRIVQWAPVLKEDSAISEAIDNLAHSLWKSEKKWFPESDLFRYRSVAAASLAHGHPGIALFWANLGGRFGGKMAEKRVLYHLDLAFARTACAPMQEYFFEGISGVAYTASLLSPLLRHSLPGSDPLGVSDTAGAVLSALRKPRRKFSWELCYGLVGLGIFFLEYTLAGGSPEGLLKVIDGLAHMAQEQGDDIVWPAVVGELEVPSRQADRQAHYNLGMAHGVPAAISFLSNVYATGIQKESLECIVRGSVGWLLKQRLAYDGIAFFPEIAVEDEKSEPSRLRWCYGDLPIAVSLWTAGIHLGVPEWRKIALDVFMRAADRPIEEAGTVGVSLCHGLTSVAHIFNRAYQATGEERLKEASRRWFYALLASRKPGTGIGGWTYEMPGPQGKPIWHHNPGLLNGAAGVGLALLAAVGDQEPMWDSCMLLDMPRMAP